MPDPIGARVRRVEDARLLQGQGRYVGDLRLPGMLHAAFVRSPHAHARIAGLRLDAARAMRGVVAVMGAADLPVLTRPLTPLMEDPAVLTRLAAPLAGNVVRHVGEAVAVVVAAAPDLAADAVDVVEVEYEPLPVAADAATARRADAALVHDDVPGNLAGRLEMAFGDAGAAIAAAASRAADVVLREQFTFARVAGGALEPRGVAAQPGAPGDAFDVTVWTSTQAPYGVRRSIAAALDLPARRVRVVTPDVGGAFGVKARVYPEEIVLPALALHLRRPVSWVATRQEEMLTTCQGRDQVVDAELAANADGVMLGLRVHITQDCGAYLPAGLVVPMHTAQHVLGPYRVPAYRADVNAYYTHKAPLSPVRGGGRPQGVFVMERLLDHLARRLDLDPLEVRRRNVLQPGDFPYDTGFRQHGSTATVVYDSGDYPTYLERARAAIGYDAVRQSQSEERRAGRNRYRYRGVAVTMFLESTGSAQESARVEITETGAVRVLVGASSQGQGHATSLAQVCAARLGVPIERIMVEGGDTAAVERGVPTVASRTAVMAGNAVAMAARAARGRVLTAAAELLEVAPDDLELSGGVIAVRGVPQRQMALADLARVLYARGAGRELSASETFAPARAACFAGGAHAALVEVDIETGLVTLQRYVVVHDCGTVINPTIVDGQVHGGVAHGIGNALYEAMRYDETGQLVTASFMDYAMPHATALPAIEVAHVQTPSPFNAEGIKGAGEGGTIGALATIAGAVEDALAPFGITVNDLPIRCERLARNG